MTSDAPRRAAPRKRPASGSARGPAPDPDRRAALLAAASHLLAVEGPEGLTVRRIAAEAGCSTMGVYSRFGGKDGIVEALFVDGFRSLRAAMEAAGGEADPQRALAECGLAYRRFGLENPTEYQVMFEGVVPGFVPSDDAHLEGIATFGTLVAKVQRAVAAGVLAPGDATELAHRFWAASHGWVSLEIHGLGWLGDAQEQAYAHAMDSLVAGMAGPAHQRDAGAAGPATTTARRRPRSTPGPVGSEAVSAPATRPAEPSARRRPPRQR